MRNIIFDASGKIRKCADILGSVAQKNLNSRLDGLYFRSLEAEEFEAEETHYREQVSFVNNRENGEITSIDLWVGDIKVSGEGGGGSVKIHKAVRINIGQQYGGTYDSTYMYASHNDWTENTDFVNRYGWEWVDIPWGQENIADNPNLYSIEETHSNWNAAKTRGTGLFLYPNADGYLQRGFIHPSVSVSTNAGGEDNGTATLDILVTRDGGTTIERLTYNIIFGGGYWTDGQYRTTGYTNTLRTYVHCVRTVGGVTEEGWFTSDLGSGFMRSSDELFNQFSNFRGSQCVLTLGLSADDILNEDFKIYGIYRTQSTETYDTVSARIRRSLSYSSRIAESSKFGRRLGLYYSLTDGSALDPPYIYGFTEDLKDIARIVASTAPAEEVE